MIHPRALYILDGGTRVPFIVHWPGHTQKGVVSNALVSQMDLVASFAALTGREISDTTGLDSQNMLPVLLGKTKKGRDYLVEQTNGASPLALVKGKWKYIESSNKKQRWIENENHIESGFSSEPQLYNLSQDVGEKQNVASQFPDTVKQMKEFLEKTKNQTKRLESRDSNL